MRVLALGSCRIDEPLAAAEDAGDIEYLNRLRSRPVYLHDIHEAIQSVRLVRGEIAMPRGIRVFAYSRGVNIERRMFSALQRTDWVVVEVCTDKHYEADGWTLNINELYERLVQAAGAPGREWWATIDRGQKPSETLALEVEAELKARWRTRWSFGEAHRLVLRRLVLRYVSAAEMAQGLADLRALLSARILVVPHVAVRLPDGQYLAERLQHVEKAIEAARTVGLPYLDPRTFVVRDGQPRALGDDGRDYNHYAANYIPLVGREIVRAISARGPYQADRIDV
jgi:hypothetical protein